MRSGRLLATMRTLCRCRTRTLLAVALSPGLVLAGISRSIDSRQGSLALLQAHAASAVAHTNDDTSHVFIHHEAVKFFTVWKSAWLASQIKDWPKENGRDPGAPVHQAPSVRLPYVHCHYDARTDATQSARLGDPAYPILRSAFTVFSLCPTWVLGETPTADDESIHADAAIHPTQRETVHEARKAFIDAVAGMEREHPDDNFFVGQHVRLLLDQEMADSALAVATHCAAQRWWCLALQGYAEHYLNNTMRADTVFASAYTQMPENVRCDWHDIIYLLPDNRRPEFAARDCAERTLLSDRYWWLADPLFSKPGNERLEVHQVRMVRLLLQSALPADGRFTWLAEYGTDARARLMIRYGWPSYIAWGGNGNDTEHNRYLAGKSSVEQPPYTTYEYSRGRIHTGPMLRVLDNPLLASDSSWSLYSAWGKSSFETWWPDEHFNRARKLIAIPAGQIAMMRRADSVLLAVAHDINDARLAPLGNDAIATTLIAPNPGTLIQLGRSSAPLQSPLFLRANISDAPTLFALEISSPAPSGADARRRIAIVPPQKLRAMRAGEVAISEPVILRPVSDTAATVAGDALLREMLGSTTISRKQQPKVSVYWETYGIRAQDSVQVTVTIERRSNPGALRRIGIALRVADNLNSSVSISWHEPDLRRAVRTLAGNVPVQIRTVTLDISRLAPGDYDVVTGIAGTSRSGITSRRSITIVQ